MGKVLRTFLHFGSKVIRCILHAFLSLVYWRKGKTVPPIQDPLLLKSATLLAKEIRDGELKCTDVIRAYMKRIEEVEPYINATVERRFLDAMEDARQVDNLIASGKHTKSELALEKPLLGVPISVKLNLTVKGLRCTSGSLLLKDARAAEDSPSVALLKNAGAIVITTTNIPEGSLYYEAINKLYGKTCNPYDTNRTPGGSSGGEGALLGAGGSVIGLGNDLAGSIRIPCHFSGLFGHKPTMGMVPNGGLFISPHPDMAHFLNVGPMCRYAEDLVTSMRVLTSDYKAPLKFGQQVDFQQLKVHFVLNINSPMVGEVDVEIRTSITEASSYFQSRGAQVKEQTLPWLRDVNLCVGHNLMAPIKDLKDLLTAGKGKHINQILEWLKLLFGKSTLSYPCLLVLAAAKSRAWFNRRNIPHYKQRLEEICKEFDRLLEDDNSVLLLPVFPTVAPYHHEFFPWIPSTCFCSIFNCVGLPTTQCPMGFDSNGLPYGFQVVGRKDNDALTIACALELEKKFGGWKCPGQDRTV